MPSTFPTSQPANVPTCKRSNVPTYKRGAQPGNTNALKHGLYSTRHPSPFLHSPALGQSSLFSDQPIQSLRQRLLDYLLTCPKAYDTRTFLAWQRPIPAAIRSIERLTAATLKLRIASAQLQLVAAQPLQLIRWGFHQEGIDRDIAPQPPFSSANPTGKSSGVQTWKRSNVPTSFLSPTQWALIEPLLPHSPFIDQHSSIHPGRPPSDPRLLLEPILWKLAHHATWADVSYNFLPKSGSPAHLSRAGVFGEGGRRPGGVTILRYYRHLYTSGRLYTILNALYRHFETHSGTTLLALLEQGYFASPGRELVLAPAAPDTWQTRTALLLLQLASQNLRKLLRQKDFEQFARSPLFRQPALPFLLDFPFLPFQPLPSASTGSVIHHSSFLIHQSRSSFQKISELIDKIPLASPPTSTLEPHLSSP